MKTKLILKIVLNFVIFGLVSFVFWHLLGESYFYPLFFAAIVNVIIIIVRDREKHKIKNK